MKWNICKKKPKQTKTKTKQNKINKNQSNWKKNLETNIYLLWFSGTNHLNNVWT